MRKMLRRIRFIYYWLVYGKNYGEVFHVPDDKFIQWLMVDQYQPKEKDYR